MRFGDLFELAIRMFKARTSRTMLTILGMSIGIGAILILVSLGYGLQKTLLERITTSESLLTLDVTEPKEGFISLDKEIVSEMMEIDGVAEISPSFQVNAQGEVDKLSVDMVVVGTTPSFFRLGGIEISEGKMINDEEKNGIIITSALAGVLGKEVGELMGKEMNFIYYVPRQNDGQAEATVETKDSAQAGIIIGSIESESTMAYVHADALEYLGVERYSEVKVRAQSSEEIDAIRDTILNQGLQVSSLSDTVDQANQIFNVLKLILMLFGIVALVVSAIGMFNTMTITLLERTEEIGIMKSIGATNRAISIMFVMESTIMGFLGGIVGIGIGLGGGELFDFGINTIAKRFGGESVDLFFTPMWFILLIILFSSFVGFSTGAVPARRASKIDPLDALRYK